MNHAKHSYLMIGPVAGGAVLFLTGNAGDLLLLLWPLACMSMMVWMMWGMGGMGRSAPGPAGPHPHHDDGHGPGRADGAGRRCRRPGRCRTANRDARSHVSACAQTSTGFSGQHNLSYNRGQVAAHVMDGMSEMHC